MPDIRFPHALDPASNPHSQGLAVRLALQIVEHVSKLIEQ
jgi:hypothetical protein